MPGSKKVASEISTTRPHSPWSWQQLSSLFWLYFYTKYRVWYCHSFICWLVRSFIHSFIYPSVFLFSPFFPLLLLFEVQDEGLFAILHSLMFTWSFLTLIFNKERKEENSTNKWNLENRLHVIGIPTGKQCAQTRKLGNIKICRLSESIPFITLITHDKWKFDTAYEYVKC